MGRFSSGRSGRFSTRSRSRERGQGRSGKSGRGDNRKKSHNTIEYKFGTQTGKGFATFASVRDHISSYVQKTYEYGGDIGQAIQEQKEIAFSQFEPKLKAPRALTAEELAMTPDQQQVLLTIDEQSRVMNYKVEYQVYY